MWKNIVGTLIKVERIAFNYPIYQSERYIKRWVKPTLFIFKHKQLKERSDPSNPKKPDPRNTFLEWNQDAELYSFGKRLNEEFDLNLLRTAFTFRSYIIQEESRHKDVGMDNYVVLEDNYKLIQKGESFMSDYIQAYLETALPNFPIDGIMAVKNYLLTEKMISYVSRSLGTKDIILSDEYPVSEAVLAKAFKAIVGALIESSGEERAAHFVRDFVIVNLNGVDLNDLWKIDDPLEMLSNILEKSGKKAEYRLIQELGKNTLLACFKVGIYIDKQMFCAGYGESLEIAREMAAREGLKIMFGTEEHMPPIDFKIPGIPNSRKIEQSVKNQLSS